MPNIAPVGGNNPAPDLTADELDRTVGRQGHSEMTKEI
jgi:hypothetical protein